MRILVVVDMQNDFIDGALGTPEAQAIVGRVAAKVEAYKNRGDEVVFTRDTHGENYLTTQEGRNLPVKHCIRETDGWRIASAIDTSGCTILDKVTFGSMELAEYVAQRKPMSVELVGLCTDICVISNAMILKASMPEVPVGVDASCCAGVTPESHKNALGAMKACQVVILNEK